MILLRMGSTSTHTPEHFHLTAIIEEEEKIAWFIDWESKSREFDVYVMLLLFGSGGS